MKESHDPFVNTTHFHRQLFDNCYLNPQLCNDQKLWCLNSTESCVLFLPAHPSRLFVMPPGPHQEPASLRFPVSSPCLITALSQILLKILNIVQNCSLPAVAPLLFHKFLSKNKAHAFGLTHLFINLF